MFSRTYVLIYVLCANARVASVPNSLNELNGRFGSSYHHSESHSFFPAISRILNIKDYTLANDDPSTTTTPSQVPTIFTSTSSASPSAANAQYRDDDPLPPTGAPTFTYADDDALDTDTPSPTALISIPSSDSTLAPSIILTVCILQFSNNRN